MVQNGIEQGDVAKEIDLDMAVFAINTLGKGLRQYIPAQLGLDTKQLAEKGVDADIDLKAIEQIYDDLFQILEHGLGNRASLPVET